MTDSTLRRGLSLLRCLGSSESGLTVSELVVETGIERSQVSRTMGTLIDLGAVTRDTTTRAYRLSWSTYALAATAGDQRLLEAARPIIDRLAAVTGSPAHLTVLDGVEVITVASGFPPFFAERRNPIGERTPAWCTSSGRTLLAGLADDTLRRRLSSVTFDAPGAGAPRSLDDAVARVRETRGVGPVVVSDEYAVELLGVAAPVQSGDGEVIAALNISGPTWRLGSAIDTLRDAVGGAARELTAALAR